jgi:hypothetical protein
VYKQLAQQVDSEVQSLKQKHSEYEARYDPAQMKVIIEEATKTSEGVQKKVAKVMDPYELRIKCKCAGCIDEVDGRQILQVNKVPKDVYPTNM